MALTEMLVPICLYCLKCTEFGQLILTKIVKTVAIRCKILRLKCTKFDFSCAIPHTPLGQLTALSYIPYLHLRVVLSRGEREGERKGCYCFMSVLYCVNKFVVLLLLMFLSVEKEDSSLMSSSTATDGWLLFYFLVFS